MNQIYIRAIEHWGTAAQANMAMGEMGELIAALNRFYTQDRKDQLENLQEEIADVQIMLNQLKIVHGVQAINDIEKQKLTRLSKIIDSQELHSHVPIESTKNVFTYEYNEDEGLTTIFANGQYVTELLEENGDPEASMNWFANAYSMTNFALGYQCVNNASEAKDV